MTRPYLTNSFAGCRVQALLSPSARGMAASLAAAALGASLLFPGAAHAQRNTGPGLSPDLPYANEVERQAAAANQAAFVALDPLCNPNGVFDQSPAPDFGDLDPVRGPSGGECTEVAFFVYLTARELVHTANELQNAGPTVASLRVDQQGLGTALRWTAAEELAAQGSMATEFANSQLANLSARLSALRFGARGFTVAGFFDPTREDEVLLAGSRGGPRGGGASADEGQRETYSSWGGFFNGSFGYGSKTDTDLENAFDFDGSELTAGIDYRFQNNLVLGAIFGYSEQTIDFDEAASEIRVVDGGMESEGSSGILFGLFHGEKLAASASIGFQKFDYEVTRAIKYPSLNPNVESANSIARSAPEADIVTATFNVGYAFRAGRFTFEPYIGADYLDIKIDAFSEDRSVESLSGAQDSDAFNLEVAEQNFKSLDATAGLRLQLTTTPQFGVIVPFIAIEAHKEMENDSRTIRAGYAGLADAGIPGVSELFEFAIPTDEVDDSYYTWAVGVSMVLRGGRQRQYDGPITGGLMTFVQYKSLESLDNYEEQVFTAGFRYEF